MRCCSRGCAHGQAIIVVMASFGASMTLRSLLEFMFTSRPPYFSRDIQIALPLGLGLKHAGPDGAPGAAGAAGARTHLLLHAHADRPCDAGGERKSRACAGQRASMSTRRSGRPG